MKGRKSFNHQIWQKGRNIVKYIHSEDVHDIEQAIKDYNRFMILVQKYADEIIKQSRKKRELKAEKRINNLPNLGAFALHFYPVPESARHNRFRLKEAI